MDEPIKIRRHHYGDDITNWHHRVVIIWEEDDARPPGHETLQQAADRIWKFLADRKEGSIAKHEDGAEHMKLYRGGFVVGYTCEGGFLGVVAEVVK